MKRHILSNYASVVDSRTENGRSGNLNEPTRITRSMEDSDVDEFVLSGPTSLTENIENSDADEFLMTEPTRITKTIENSDADEFYQMQVLESDFDEFLSL